MLEQKNWKAKLDNFLLVYRTTPQSATGMSPAQMMFQQRSNNGILSIQQTTSQSSTEQHHKKYNNNKAYANPHHRTKIINFNEGEKVLVKNISKSKKLFYQLQPYTVIENYPHSFLFYLLLYQKMPSFFNKLVWENIFTSVSAGAILSVIWYIWWPSVQIWISRWIKISKSKLLNPHFNVKIHIPKFYLHEAKVFHVYQLYLIV